MLIVQFKQLSPRVLIASIQLDRPRVHRAGISDIVVRLVTVSQTVPCVRGMGIGPRVHLEERDG